MLIRTRRSFCAAALSISAGLLLGAQTCSAQTAVGNELRIVSASFGRPHAAHAQDFSERLQQICGDHGVACQSFCSKSLTGADPGLHVPFTARPVCRVIYRCGEGLTQAAETEDGEIIALSCRQGR